MSDRPSPDTGRTFDDRAAPLDYESDDRKEVRERLRVRPAVIYEVVRAEGEEEIARRNTALIWSGLAAGFSISFSMVVLGILKSALPDADWAQPLTAIGYTAGFIIVILARQQLFTENTITALLPVMTRYSDANWRSMFRLWGLVLGANVLGASFFAWAAARLPLFSTEVNAAFYEIGAHIFENSAWEMFIKAVPAGWLIAGLVWTLPSVRYARFWVIFFFTWIIALGEFPHIIAGTTETVYYMLQGGVGLAQLGGQFFIPTLLGNIFGGSALFALFSYAQVKEEVTEVAGGQNGDQPAPDPAGKRTEARLRNSRQASDQSNEQSRG